MTFELDAAPALVVIDLQQAILGRPTAHPANDIADRSGRLAAAFRTKGLPVVLVNVTGGAPGRTEASRGTTPEQKAAMAAMLADPAASAIVPHLDPQPSDIRVTKRTWGAFHGTDLDAQLRARSVTQVVLTGISTSAGVESTARAAHEHGYNVLFVTDAMTDSNPAAHDNSLAHVFPRLGELATTDEVVAALS